MGVEYRHYLLPRDRGFRPSAPELLRLVEALRRERWIVDPRTPRFAAMISALVERYQEDERVGLWEPPRGLRRLWPWWRRLRAHTPFRFEYDRPAGHAKRSGAYARIASGCLPGEHALAEDWLAAHQREPVRLVWPVPSLALSGLRYPIRPRPYEERHAERVYYQLELHWCDDFVYHTSELIDPFAESPACECGEALEYDAIAEHDDPPFFDAAIRRTCPRCGSPFRPDALACTIRNAFTSDEREVRGGAAYRFALLVDCGKWIPDAPDGWTRLEEDLVNLCSTTLDQALEEISDGSF